MSRLFWKRRFLFVSLLSLSTFAPAALAQSPAEARAEVKEWIKIQKTLSEEKADWAVERAVIEDMIRILEQEEADLEERIETGQAAVSTADEKRAEFEASRDALRSATTSLQGALPAIESSVMALYASFPTPLQEIVEPLYNRLESSGDDSRLSLADRLQAIVGILSQADKFNSVVTTDSENRTINGESVIVKTLYFGLGGGVYADPSGATAGYLYPGEDGWIAEESPENASAILTALDIYAGMDEAAFINLPVSIR